MGLVSNGMGDILAETFEIYIRDLLRPVDIVSIILPAIGCRVPSLKMMARGLEGG
jgi:hypothetical protein